MKSALKRAAERPGNLVVLLACAGLTLLYLVDAQGKSRSIENLAFILPLSLAILALCLGLAVTHLRGGKAPGTGAADEAGPPPADPEDAAEASPALPYLAFGLFAAYVLSLPLIGFDVANVIFMTLFVWLQARRQPLAALGFGLVFGLGAALLFKAVLPYRLPMTFL